MTGPPWTSSSRSSLPSSRAPLRRPPTPRVHTEPPRSPHPGSSLLRLLEFTGRSRSSGLEDLLDTLHARAANGALGEFAALRRRRLLRCLRIWHGHCCCPTSASRSPHSCPTSASRRPRSGSSRPSARCPRRCPGRRSRPPRARPAPRSSRRPRSRPLEGGGGTRAGEAPRPSAARTCARCSRVRRDREQRRVPRADARVDELARHARAVRGRLEREHEEHAPEAARLAALA